jgi:hypothetical protein
MQVLGARAKNIAVAVRVLVPGYGTYTINGTGIGTGN